MNTNSLENLHPEAFASIISNHHNWKYRILGEFDTVAQKIKILKETSKKMKKNVDISSIEKNLLKEKIDAAKKNIKRGPEKCHPWACGSSQDMWYGYQSDTLNFYKSRLPIWEHNLKM